MSRVGNRIINIPAGVTVEANGNVVTVKGPKGELSTIINKNITVEIEENEVKLQRKNDNFKQFHGTANALINNMIKGVKEGFSKGLEAVGVGYRFQVQGNKININANFSHPVIIEVPSDLKVEQVSNTEITISGIDKQRVSEFAANVRAIREPEPYKGKGIRYKGEHVRRKEGKKAAK